MSDLHSYPNPALAGLRLPGGVRQPTLWYQFVRGLFRIGVCTAWNVRVFNRHYEPARGSVVYISNHQSFLDPILMSFALRRPVNYMAREGLFRVPIFRHLIHTLNAFPVKRGSADTGAMKEAMRRLKAGGQVQVFAEGTRTLDGRIGKFLRGVGMLAQRSADWTVPVLIDGAYECWPRTQKLPGPGSLVVQYAPPIPKAEACKMDPRDFVERVRQTLIEIQTDVRRREDRPQLTYDA